MLNLLQNEDDLDAIGRSLQGSALCEQLLCRISLAGAEGCKDGNAIAEDSESRLPHLRALTRDGVASPDANGFLSNACALQSGTHRLLIQPDPVPPDGSNSSYRLFSCVLSGLSTCDFEVNR